MSHDSVSRGIQPGERHTFTVTGTVRALDDEHGCARVEDAQGWNHWVYVDSAAIKAERAAPEYEVGKLYQDDDGEILLRVNEGWRGLDGKTQPLDSRGSTLRPVALPYNRNPW